jgi:hypothetical protein
MSAEITNPTTDQIIASALQLPAPDSVQIVAAIKRSLTEESTGNAFVDLSKEAAS